MHMNVYIHDVGFSPTEYMIESIWLTHGDQLICIGNKIALENGPWISNIHLLGCAL